MKMRKENCSTRYSEVVSSLLREVPEISVIYQQEQLKWGLQSIPPHIAYGSLFSDFLRQILTAGTREIGHSRSDIIRRSFGLIEELAQSPDFQTRCVVEASVLESLLGEDKDDWQRFSPFFGKATLQMALGVAEKMGIRTNSPKRYPITYGRI